MAPAGGATGAETPTLVESIAVEGGVELLENGEGGWYDEDGTRWFYYDVQPELHRYTVTFTASGTEGFGIISDELRITLYDAQGRPIPGVQGAYDVEIAGQDGGGAGAPRRHQQQGGSERRGHLCGR